MKNFDTWWMYNAPKMEDVGTPDALREYLRGFFNAIRDEAFEDGKQAGFIEGSGEGYDDGLKDGRREGAEEFKGAAIQALEKL